MLRETLRQMSPRPGYTRNASQGSLATSTSLTSLGSSVSTMSEAELNQSGLAGFIDGFLASQGSVALALLFVREFTFGGCVVIVGFRERLLKALVPFVHMKVNGLVSEAMEDATAMQRGSM